MSNFFLALAHMPLFVWIALLVAFIVPGISALLTSAPKPLTGVLTAVLSILNGIIVDAIHAAATGDTFDWSKAFGTALLAWAVATIAHSKIYQATPLEESLHARGAHL